MCDPLGNPKNTEIVRAIVQLAHSLGVKTVAEGVETPGQTEILASLGCDALQGYLLSPPVPESDFPLFLTQFKARHQLSLVSQARPSDNQSPSLQTIS